MTSTAIQIAGPDQLEKSDGRLRAIGAASSSASSIYAPGRPGLAPRLFRP
jgi:hypothetical protein